MSRFIIFDLGKPPREQEAPACLDSLEPIRELIPLPRGYVEHVNVLFEGKRAHMFVHEEGLLLGLPRNDPATKIYRAAWLARHPKDDPESLSYIIGPAVLYTGELL
jgi:hypothetical protein